MAIRLVAEPMFGKPNMTIPKQPKGMKDPVLIAGNWEERNPPHPCAGKTRADFDSIDEEHKEAIKEVPRATAEDIKAHKALTKGK